jgi:hypothetical protein
VVYTHTHTEKPIHVLTWFINRCTFKLERRGCLKIFGAEVKFFVSFAGPRICYRLIFILLLRVTKPNLCLR